TGGGSRASPAETGRAVASPSAEPSAAPTAFVTPVLLTRPPEAAALASASPVNVLALTPAPASPPAWAWLLAALVGALLGAVGFWFGLRPWWAARHVSPPETQASDDQRP
ncbi:MAG TPA: hypothetical protein VF157_10220, partial [Chloroflexota bacterium]